MIKTWIGYLELLGMPYTGCNPRGLMLARDKSLSKKILAYHRILHPRLCIFPYGAHREKAQASGVSVDCQIRVPGSLPRDFPSLHCG